MPRIQIQMVEGRTIEQKRRLVSKLVDSTAEALEISKDRISVVIQELKEDQLAHGGVLWCDRKEKPKI